MFGAAIVGGVFVFSLALIAHILIWRFLAPKREILCLALLFLALPLLLSLIACISLLSGVLALCLGAVYVMTYPAVQAESPTLVLLLYLQKQGAASAAELEKYFAEKNMVAARLHDMKRDGLIDEKGSTLFGRILIWFFKNLRRALSIRENG